MSDDAASPPGETTHITLEIRYTNDGVEGAVVRDGLDGRATFSSWMELLRLLESPLAAGPEPHDTQYRNGTR